MCPSCSQTWERANRFWNIHDIEYYRCQNIDRFQENVEWKKESCRRVPNIWHKDSKDIKFKICRKLLYYLIWCGSKDRKSSWTCRTTHAGRWSSLGVRRGVRVDYEKGNTGGFIYIFLSEVGWWPQSTCLILLYFFVYLKKSSLE